MKIKPTNLIVIAGGALVLFLAVVAFSSVVILTGCGDGPISVGEISPLDRTSFFDLPYDPEAFAKSLNISVDTIMWFESFITTADGGVIVISEDPATDGTAYDAFVVQEESFPYDTTFELEVIKIVTSDGEMPIVYDFGPDGLVFSECAILLVNAWEDFGRKTEEVCLYWLNEETHLWELQECLAVNDEGLVAFCLEHFTKYGTGSGGGTTTTNKPDNPGPSDPPSW
ncbi:MAG: hypothetical protein JSU74_03320 [Candidatus Zixiibacteriota bacterium]|nr:MAG: hypothetical protein JSU74_03320 [candidate division Zixibacteria bacterium]